MSEVSFAGDRVIRVQEKVQELNGWGQCCSWTESQGKGTNSLDNPRDWRIVPLCHWNLMSWERYSGPFLRRRMRHRELTHCGVRMDEPRRPQGLSYSWPAGSEEEGAVAPSRVSRAICHASYLCATPHWDKTHTNSCIAALRIKYNTFEPAHGLHNSAHRKGSISLKIFENKTQLLSILFFFSLQLYWASIFTTTYKIPGNRMDSGRRLSNENPYIPKSVIRLLSL